MATEKHKIFAWQKARLHPRFPDGSVRIDIYGSIMVWKDYGLLTDYGWEIDHMLPKSGFPNLTNVAMNYQALHWRNNRSKSDKIDLASFLR